MSLQQFSIASNRRDNFSKCNRAYLQQLKTTIPVHINFLKKCNCTHERSICHFPGESGCADCPCDHKKWWLTNRLETGRWHSWCSAREYHSLTLILSHHPRCVTVQSRECMTKTSPKYGAWWTMPVPVSSVTYVSRSTRNAPRSFICIHLHNHRATTMSSAYIYTITTLTQPCHLHTFTQSPCHDHVICIHLHSHHATTMSSAYIYTITIPRPH